MISPEFRDALIESIQQSSVDDPTNVREIVNISQNYEDDTVRIYARLWLERNVINIIKHYTVIIPKG